MIIILFVKVMLSNITKLNIYMIILVGHSVVLTISPVLFQLFPGISSG